MSKYSVIAPKSEKELIQHFGSTYEHIQDKAKVLDVGCSTGYYGRLLIEDKDCQVDGIEIDPKDRAEAEKYLNSVYDVNLDKPEWPIALTSNKYDVIFLGDVIEHVLDAENVLLRLGDLLVENGKIIISTPNIAHLSIRMELLLGNFEYERTGILDETHLKYFTLDSLTSIVHATGYTVLETDYSLNELHPDTVKHMLEQAGLRPTQLFWKQMQEPEARAYQWKMVIQKSGKPYMKAKPILKPMQHNYWFVGQTKQLAAKNAELSSRLEEQVSTLSDTRAELESVKRSFGWRLERKIKSFFSKAT